MEAGIFNKGIFRGVSKKQMRFKKEAANLLVLNGNIEHEKGLDLIHE